MPLSLMLFSVALDIKNLLRCRRPRKGYVKPLWTTRNPPATHFLTPIRTPTVLRKPLEPSKPTKQLETNSFRNTLCCVGKHSDCLVSFPSHNTLHTPRLLYRCQAQGGSRSRRWGLGWAKSSCKCFWSVLMVTFISFTVVFLQFQQGLFDMFLEDGIHAEYSYSTSFLLKDLKKCKSSMKA